jgi:hypothetical protein
MRLECKNIEACTDYYVALDVGKDWVKPKCLGSICKKCIHADKCKKDKSDNTTLTCEYKIMCFLYWLGRNTRG